MASRRKRQLRATKMVELVQNIRISQPRIGTRKLYHILYNDLQALNVLFAILKADKMLVKPKRNYVTTTNSYHRFYKHKNLIENTLIDRPEQVWVADITYVCNWKNPMYLSLITDAYSKKIMGYHWGNTLETKQSLRALKKAVKNRIYPNLELIHHSDKGLQYCSDNYQNMLLKYKYDRAI